MILTKELRRLRSSGNSEDILEGIGFVTFTVFCPSNSTSVLNRCKEVLECIIINTIEDQWLSHTDWAVRLPQWFVESCAPEMSQEETQKWLSWWRGLSPEEQSQAEESQRWSLQDWLYWMQPEHRKWFWWDAIIEDLETLKIIFEVKEWPFAWSSLAWLVRASGADKIISE